MSKKQLRQILINDEWCKGCGICIHFCPKEVLAFTDEDKAIATQPEKCIVCLMCELRCPDLAIEVTYEI